MPFQDTCGRAIEYLRISVTDRCNLRCRYCMPAQGVPFRPHDEILRYEEIVQVVRAAVGLGITKFRLTGGEPLVRKGIVELVAMLARIPSVQDLAMTTNGTLLSHYAEALARAGLRRVNISLDTLDEEKYAQLTRGGRLADALEGIHSAERAGLRPVKINTVVVRGLNDDEVVALARLTLEHPWEVRFIELMPVGDGGEGWQGEAVPGAEVAQRIGAALGELAPAEGTLGNGPARYYRLPGAKGTLGFITPLSEHFCAQCNRIRLTADGHLRPCLLADGEIDVKAALRRGADLGEIQALLLQAIATKPDGHHLREASPPKGRGMSEIGG